MKKVLILTKGGKAATGAKKQGSTGNLATRAVAGARRLAGNAARRFRNFFN